VLLLVVVLFSFVSIRPVTGSESTRQGIGWARKVVSTVAYFVLDKT